jgi:hypothetical protein
MPTQSNSSVAPAPEARELLERAIECLIALLDLQEGDPELEEGGDEEATLGWPNADHRAGAAGQVRLYPEERDGDNEPSLGWGDMESRYGHYDWQSRQGLEEEHDGSEPSLGWQNDGSQRALRTACQDGELEPSLGWQNQGSQHLLQTSRNDCEEQCEDEGRA